MDKCIFRKLKDEIRALESARAAYLFGGGDAGAVVSELSRYQNEDGGFGHGMEPDFEMPFSSPIATWSAFEIMSEIGYEGCGNMAQRAAEYLASVFDSKESRWYAADPRVNDYSHTPWWHHDETKGRCPIDGSKGNPTASLLARLIQCGADTDLDIKRLSAEYIDYFTRKDVYESEHEVFCFIDLWEQVEGEMKDRLKESLSDAVSQLVTLEPEKWQEYRPSPLKFVRSPEGPFWGIRPESVSLEIRYIKDRLNKAGLLEPNWPAAVYSESHYKKAWPAWKGILTLNALKILERFAGF